ncbi:MAG: hypothetical protein AAF485_03945 [Chloroflexota bacterium]
MSLKRQQLLMITGSLILGVALLFGAQFVLAAQIGTLTRVTTAFPDDSRGAFSPDVDNAGAKIVFHSNIDFFGQGAITDNQFEIWLYDTATMTVTRITTSSDPSTRDSREAHINGNGTVIAFESDSDFFGQGITTTQNEIWLYDIGTMALTKVTTSSEGGLRRSDDPALNVDGTIVAFETESDLLGEGLPDQREVWLYNTTTMSYTRVTSNSGNNTDSENSSLNADGAIVAFESDSDLLGEGRPANIDEIWLYNTTTMSYTRITSASHSNRDSFEPSLNADGTIVAFHSDSDFLGEGRPVGVDEVWLYNTTTMTYTRVTSDSDSDRDSDNVRLSGDGTRIVFESDSDLLGQTIPGNQDEIWLYDTNTMTFTRITTASDSNRSSSELGFSDDGTKIVFHSDSDFLTQSIADQQREVWLVTLIKDIYMPIIRKNS